MELQLGFAIDNVKASLAVKRRLACEQAKVWVQVCCIPWFLLIWAIKLRPFGLFYWQLFEGMLEVLIEGTNTVD